MKDVDNHKQEGEKVEGGLRTQIVDEADLGGVEQTTTRGRDSQGGKPRQEEHDDARTCKVAQQVAAALNWQRK